MTNKFKKVIMGVIGAAALAGAVTSAKAQEVSGNFKWFQSAEGKNAPGTYAEVNAWYPLPAEIKGFTFLDAYPTSASYFGKTNLTKKIVGNLNAAMQMKHIGEPLSEAGIGAKLSIPVKNGYGGVALFPFWADKRGNGIDKVVVGFAFGKDLGHGFNFETFAEGKFSNGRYTHGYGEVELTKRVGPFKIGYIGALQPDGDATPKLEHRLGIRYDWKFGEKK